MHRGGGCQWCVYVGNILGLNPGGKETTFQRLDVQGGRCVGGSVAEEGRPINSSHSSDLLLLAAAPSL